MAPRSATLGFLGLTVCVGALIGAAPSRAHLGGPSASVEADRAHLAATRQSTATGTHTVHALTLANGGLVREFARADGVVFAVTWRGPGRPDLRQLLGEHFTTLQADNAVRVGRHTRRPMVVNRSDFVLMSGGHSGAFWGVAILPRLQPAGFSASDLR